MYKTGEIVLLHSKIVGYFPTGAKPAEFSNGRLCEEDLICEVQHNNTSEHQNVLYSITRKFTFYCANHFIDKKILK